MGTVGTKIWGVVNAPALGAGLGVANLIVGGVTCGKVCSLDSKFDSFTGEFSKTSKAVIDNSKDTYEMACVAKDTVTKMNGAVNDISGYFKEMKELDAQNPPQQQMPPQVQPQQMQQMQPQQVQANWADLTQKQIFEKGKAAAIAEIEAQKAAESKDKKIEALEAEIAKLKNGGTSEDEKLPGWLNALLEKNPDKAVDLINAFVGGVKNQQPEQKQQPEVDPMLAAKAAEYDRMIAMQKEAEERQKEAEAQQKMQSFADKIQAKFDSYDEALSKLGTAVTDLNSLLTTMQSANDANKGNNKKNN